MKTFIHLFADGDKIVEDLKKSKITNIKPCLPTQFSLHSFFVLTLENGNNVSAKLCEEELYSLFYVNKDVSEDAGREVYIALDVALGANGCEAIVEGFYSVMKRPIRNQEVKPIKFWFNDQL